MDFDVNEINDKIKGKILYWEEDKKISRICQDFAKIKQGCLYILSNYIDDEDYLIERLKEYKVSGIITKHEFLVNVEKWKDAKIGVIEVDSIHTTSYILARLYREKFNIPFIEVTGSAGKTTTKEMIGCVLNEEKDTLVSYENYNAPGGVAYNIFRLQSNHEASVLEVGMKDFGIIDLSSYMIKPDIGVITCIQRAHYLNLGSIENIIKAKAEIIDHLTNDGFLIINGDDDNCRKLPLHKFKGKLYTFGFSKENDIYATDINYHKGITYFKANYKNYSINCKINIFGKYNVRNALAAILIGLILGVSNDSIVKGLSKFKPLHRRQELLNGINNSLIIYDNFNANPDSTKMLLSELANIASNRPLILVLGDLERPNKSVEDYARKIHYEIGKSLVNIKFDYLIAIGKWAEEYVNGAKDSGINEDKLYYYSSTNEAKTIIKNCVKPNSVIVFKAQLAYIDLKKLIEVVSK